MNLELSIFVAQVDTEEVSTDNQNAELKKILETRKLGNAPDEGTRKCQPEKNTE